MPMPRLQDGSPDERAEELEETETNPLTEWLATQIRENNLQHQHTVNGIAHYRMLTPVVFG